MVVVAGAVVVRTTLAQLAVEKMRREYTR